MTDDIARKASEALRYVLSPFENYSDDAAKGGSMNDITRMAREAGLSNDFGRFGYPYLPELERFAALVADAEREACAKLCEDMEEKAEGTECCKWPTPADCAYAIRARGTRPTSVIYSPGELAARGLTHEDVVKLIKENT